LIDPRSLKVLRGSAVHPGAYSPQIASGHQVVWVLTAHGLVRVDPGTGRITAAVQTAWNPQVGVMPALGVDPAGRVWVAGTQLTVLLPGSLTPRRVARADGVTNVAVTGPDLWADTGTTLIRLAVSFPPVSRTR
jgi:hypothetical protein